MSIKYSLGLAIAVAFSLAIIQSGIIGSDDLQLYSRFSEWKSEHGMTFDPVEEVYRFEVFRKNLAEI